jgi:hypothetical protein
MLLGSMLGYAVGSGADMLLGCTDGGDRGSLVGDSVIIPDGTDVSSEGAELG